MFHVCYVRFELLTNLTDEVSADKWLSFTVFFYQKPAPPGDNNTPVSFPVSLE